MQSTWTRVAVLAALAAAVALFIVLTGGDDDDSDTNGTTARTQAGTQTAPEPSEPVIEVRSGQPVGGVQRLAFDKGDRASFEVQLMEPEEEIHVHGYELTRSARRSPVRFSFAATLEGVFEVEVHREDGTDVQIAELRVSP